MFTPMIGIFCLIAACMLSVFPAIAFYNESKETMRDWKLLSVFALLIVLAFVIAIVPIHLVAEMKTPADGNTSVIYWCRWGVGLPLTISGIATFCYMIGGAAELTHWSTASTRNT